MKNKKPDNYITVRGSLLTLGLVLVTVGVALGGAVLVNDSTKALVYPTSGQLFGATPITNLTAKLAADLNGNNKAATNLSSVVTTNLVIGSPTSQTTITNSATASRTIAIPNVSGIFQINDNAQNFVFEGDSLTTSYGLSAGQDWPTYVMLLDQFSGRGTKYNVALAGDTLAGITTSYASEVYPRRPTGSVLKSTLFVWIGANDFATAIPSIYITSLESYWQTAKTDGFKVIGFTIIPRGDHHSAAEELKRHQINTLIRRSTIWDGVNAFLVDVDLLFNDYSDTTWYQGDTIHLTQNGYKILASFVNNSVSANGSLNRGVSANGAFNFPSLRVGGNAVPTPSDGDVAIAGNLYMGNRTDNLSRYICGGIDINNSIMLLTNGGAASKHYCYSGNYAADGSGGGHIFYGGGVIGSQSMLASFSNDKIVFRKPVETGGNAITDCGGIKFNSDGSASLPPVYSLNSRGSGLYWPASGRVGISAATVACWDIGSDSRLQQGDLIIEVTGKGIKLNNDNYSVTAGTGSPEGSITAKPGSIRMRTDGSTNTVTYTKCSGTGNTGWLPVANLNGDGSFSVVGATNNFNASSAYLGYYTNSVVTSGNAVSLTTATPTTITTLPIPGAGAWDVTFVIDYVTTGATTTDFKSGSSFTTNTFGAQDSFVNLPFITTALSDTLGHVGPTYRYTTTSATNIYLIGQGNFSIGTSAAYGSIRAVRAQ